MQTENAVSGFRLSMQIGGADRDCRLRCRLNMQIRSLLAFGIMPGTPAGSKHARQDLHLPPGINMPDQCAMVWCPTSIEGMKGMLILASTLQHKVGFGKIVPAGSPNKR